jgi:hypothetical protein
MLGIALFAFNSILTVFIGYHIIRYGRGERILMVMSAGYALFVVVSASMLLTHLSL